MTKNFKITVDGRSYTVAVEDLAPTAAPASAVAPTPAAAAPAPAPTPPLAHPAAAAPAPTLPAAGGPGAIEAPGGPGAIEAPIGGVVRSIDVEVGHAVAVGDKVAVIEVMKMKTAVHSKIAGKVTDIMAKVNEPVETGQQMMTLA